MTPNPLNNLHAPAIVFLAALTCLGNWHNAFAQTDDQNSASAVRIVSKPSGATVDLRGEHEFKGKTPFILPYQLSGKYRIEASRPGYETTAWEYTFAAQRPGLLNLKLQAKRPSKALYRSLILPGWGQYYSGKKLWGTLFCGLTAASTLAYGLNEADYGDAQDQHRGALKQFNIAVVSGTNDDQRAALAELNTALRTLNSSERSRNRAFLVLGAIWAFSAIESVVLFPRQAPQIRVGGTLDLSQREQAAELKLTMKLAID
ncbi:MAG: DUF5683 domain-containing protein [bacterium]